ncbi:Cytochrome P450 monooxygenase 205 [Psilocybe cubensis]|uniref:Cytochrome P450 monooxygenase 205 n=1 Tax=Psilocybe cubensis TaxID=181762 RepID=A0ACB8H6X4_PSICU|nr:Cytochrome P450 monooxygenase 205 [Psilocybe cubensis]KAH9483579.1 Cytochrome P450 monooxygenase 205 [Psilocybe cubensis]
MLGTDFFNFGQLFWSFGVAFVVFVVYKVANLIYDEFTSSLRDLPGPPSRNFMFGNMQELGLTKWEQQYGSTIKYKGFFGTTYFYSTDLKAMNHILMNNYEFLKPNPNIYIFKRILGDGLVFADGDVHKKQVSTFCHKTTSREILHLYLDYATLNYCRLKNPGFAPQQIREVTDLFVEKTAVLRDIWAEKLSQKSSEEPEVIDVLSWFSRLALDIIGIAGFDYNFDALVDDPSKNELGNAFAITSNVEDRINFIGFLKFIFPSLSFLPGDADPEGKRAADTLYRIAAELLEKSKAAIRKADGKSTLSRDILTLLVRANELDDVPESQRLTDKEVIAQIPTFLIAGHETTAVALAWMFYALTQNKNAQRKLREEVSNVATDNPSMDELNDLPYLDYVVRESLRLHGPVPATSRVVGQDTFVPLSKPVVDKKGVVHNEIRLQKGQRVMVPVIVVNQAKSIWGEDALEFRSGPDKTICEDPNAGKIFQKPHPVFLEYGVTA